MLWLLVSFRSKQVLKSGHGNWLSAMALFIYAAGFSYAYISLETGAGALLLFGAVQATMIGYGFYTGERLNKVQSLGLIFAFAGVIGLLLPGLSAPPLLGSLVMMVAGVAWGVYSIRGKGAGDPTFISAGNFLRTIPFVIVMTVLTLNSQSLDSAGIWYAIASGAIASGLGYAIWYSVLPVLKSTTASTVQLSVPVIAALAGIIFLSEPITIRFALASLALLGGIALVIVKKKMA
jgi:drug/metabolite transporter (DMT)-like permease